MSNALEDSVADVIGKAQRGLKLSENELSSRSGISAAELQRALAGQADAPILEKLAPVLGLNARALAGLPGYHPGDLHVEGLERFSTPWDDMIVNAYVAADFASGEAVAFDTGADCAPLLDWLRDKGVKLRLILLTHTHGDHIFDLDKLKERTGAQAYVTSREPLEGAESFEPGREFHCGALRIETRLTSGHSPGGISYIIHGLEKPVAVVGDALFAGSMGGANLAYAEALDNNRKQLFTLSPETVLCPGHGPLTTVGRELEHNPFFATL